MTGGTHWLLKSYVYPQEIARVPYDQGLWFAHWFPVIRPAIYPGYSWGGARFGGGVARIPLMLGSGIKACQLRKGESPEIYMLRSRSLQEIVVIISGPASPRGEKMDLQIGYYKDPVIHQQVEWDVTYFWFPKKNPGGRVSWVTRL